MNRPPGLCLALGGVFAAALAAGCEARSLMANAGSGLGNIGGGGTGAGGSGGAPGPFAPIRQVDLLFVIKNSSSTSSMQANLLNNFPSFLTTLQNSPGGLPDLHLAVITSDMGAGDGSVPGCNATGGDGGRFQYTARTNCSSTGLRPGATFISYANGVGNYTGPLSDVFACIAQVGTNGCGFEQPLAAAMRALGADGQPPPAENQGFLRPDAFLFIFVLMNEDDCSVPAGSGLFDSSRTTLDSPLGPLADYRCNEFGHLCDGARPPRFAPGGNGTYVETLVDGCVSAEDAGMLTPVATLAAQLRALKRYPDQQILVAALTGPSTPYTVEWQTPNPPDPAGPWPVIAHTCVGPDGSFADPAIRINQWAASFGANAKILSVCDNSYAPSLDFLAEKINEALPPPADTP